MTDVYIVGASSCDGNVVIKVCTTYEIALREFNKVRLKLIDYLRQRIDNEKKEPDPPSFYIDDLEKQIINLSEEDPDKINNFPHIKPYIEKIELTYI